MVGKYTSIGLSILFLIQPVQVCAQEGAFLWQDLREGDSPQVVADKLAALPDIKSAKVKGKPDNPRISLKYRDGGVNILGDAFNVLPQFTDASLTHVLLGTRTGCATALEPRYDRLITALIEKYPTMISERLTHRRLMQAKMAATEKNPITTSTALTDGKTVVLFTQSFYRKDEPPRPPIGATRSMMAVAQFLWSQYEITASECNGDGIYRMQFGIAYLSKQSFDKQFLQAQTEAAEELKEASDKL